MGDGGALLITGLEALPKVYLDRLALDPEVHRTLHDHGLSVYVAYRGMPPAELRRRFDAEFVLLPRAGGSWRDSHVQPVRAGAVGPVADRIVALRDFWAEEHLDPDWLGPP